MKLVLYSLSYHNCPIQLRETLTFTPQQRISLLKKMHTVEQISEAAILETCNRLEFYLYAKNDFDCDNFLARLLSQYKPRAVDVWKSYRSFYENIDVVRHLFTVAAGLDSQIIGENQILSQVKSSYTESINCRMSKLIFHRLFHNAFRVGKAVRTATAINCGAVSVALAAVELAKNKIDLPGAAAMVIGAGQNAQLVIKYLLKEPLKKLIIANRSVQKARSIVPDGRSVEVIALRNVIDHLSDIDLLISATASKQPILCYKKVEHILSKRNKPLLMIDIAVPRDIEPEISKIKSVSLYNIDDLNQQLLLNSRKRRSEIPKARLIVEQFTEKLRCWLGSLNLVPAITRLNRTALRIAETEAERYAARFIKGNGSDVEHKLKIFARMLAKKLMHGPISLLKASEIDQPATEQLLAADLINRMFLGQPEGDKK